MKADCQQHENIHAYLAGELLPQDAKALSIHIENCAKCRAFADASRRIISLLHTAPATVGEVDVLPAVLARIHEHAPLPRPAPQRSLLSSTWQRVGAIAAVLALVASLLAVFFVQLKQPAPPSTSASVERALEWLIRAQESDGSWNAERWGGQRLYTPALTALPLLALASSDSRTPHLDEATSRAAASLLRMQNSDGTFGSVFQGAPYNDSIATLALLKAWRRQPNAVPRDALERALAALCVHQTREGGWGYRYTPYSDRSITQWHIQALQVASTLGWEVCGTASERGLKWLATHSTTPPPTHHEPTDSTSAILARATSDHPHEDGTLDFYQAYFTTAALQHAPGASARQQLSSLHREILRHQVTAGAESGSWPPDDHWGRAGGRLYSTALASLALR